MRTLPIALMTAGLIGLAVMPALAAPSQADKTFAEHAAAGGLAEMQLGSLAQQKAASPQVKQFGQMLVNDHTQANQELQDIAQQLDITLPEQPPAKANAEERKLRGMSGQQFDHEFLQHAITDHRQDISAFEKEAKSGKDADLKSFAQRTLPILRKHLQMAQSLASNQQ